MSSEQAQTASPGPVTEATHAPGSEALTQVKSKAVHAIGVARDKANHVANRAAGQIQRAPLRSVAIAAAVGALVGCGATLWSRRLW